MAGQDTVTARRKKPAAYHNPHRTAVGQHGWTVYHGGGYHGVHPVMEQTAPLAVSSASQSGDEFLWGFWYPVLRSNQIRGRRLVTSTRLEVPLVLGRDAAGKAFALRDVCPHRAFPLSLGRYDGQTVECAYHGWRFEAHTGQCRLVPSITEDSKLQCDRIYAGSFPCEERDGYVWAYFANTEGRSLADGPLLSVPELPKYGRRYRIAHLSATLACSMDTAIIGLMDPAHGPFVHRSWWWRSRHSIREKQKTFEPITQGFRMSSHTPSANSAPYKLLKVYGAAVTTQIDFVLPNMRTEEVRCGKYWFTNRTTITPIRRDLCRLDFCAAWNLFSWFPLVTPLLHFFGKRFIAQDQRVIELQKPGLSVQPRMMLIDDADRQARWYFQLKSAYLASQQTGMPMQHPLEGPVTLRWRS
jgi:phenylpropionate dioxygenase-like ring-hydroxylating dioxygenase large terminal subunit